VNKSLFGIIRSWDQLFRLMAPRMSKSIRSPQHTKLRELLVAARRKAGLTQQDVADRLGRPQSFVAKYEGGERRLDVVEFLQIATVLGADPARIVRAVSAG
jgi:ribosome-binding protein aMBF1 (putative translation factor)